MPKNLRKIFFYFFFGIYKIMFSVAVCDVCCVREQYIVGAKKGNVLDVCLQ